ncbi:MAG TPA: hypothetical protein VG944_09040 [Fimbriimonas sp.]|nr:hypothetical protein [Fimbriimonas sp.]
MKRSCSLAAIFFLLLAILAEAGCSDGAVHLTKAQALDHQKKKDRLDGSK